MARTIRYLEKTTTRAATGSAMHIACGVSQHPQGRVIERPGIPLLTAALLEHGALQYRVAQGALITVTAPALIAVDPGTPFTGTVQAAGSRDTWLLVPERPQWRTLLAAWPEPAPGMRVLAVPRDGLGAAIQQTMAGIMQAYDGAHPERQALAVNGWERVLLLARALAPDGRRLHPAVAAALAYAAERPSQRHRVRELARAVGCSPSHLAALARQSLQESLMRHLRHRQLERGRDLLLGTDWPIGRIAAAVGFPDPFHFSHQFRARYGRSPRGYRQALSP